MARNVTLQGATYSDVPTIVVPSETLLASYKTITSTSSSSGAYTCTLTGEVSTYQYFPNGIIVKYDGVNYLLPYTGITSNYHGYGAPIGTNVDFTNYPIRVESENEAGTAGSGWYVFCQTSGTHLLSVTSNESARFDDCSVVTATANDVSQGKIFVAKDGTITTGTSTGGGSPLPTVLRPDAELIKTYSYDKLIVQDEGVTLPAYTTSATILKASETLETYSVSSISTNYNIMLVLKTLAYPIYNQTVHSKGRFEWWGGTWIYELVDIPANTFQTIDGSKKATSRFTSLGSNMLNRFMYWSSTTTATTTTSTYGTYFSAGSMSMSASSITVKSPPLMIRGNATYFTGTHWGYMTDARYQYIIEIYRFPKSNLDGLACGSTMLGIAEDIKNGGTLT